jgi:hypothetical protein
VTLFALSPEYVKVKMQSTRHQQHQHQVAGKNLRDPVELENLAAHQLVVKEEPGHTGKRQYDQVSGNWKPSTDEPLKNRLRTEGPAEQGRNPYRQLRMMVPLLLPGFRCRSCRLSCVRIFAHSSITPEVMAIITSCNIFNV